MQLGDRESGRTRSFQPPLGPRGASSAFTLTPLVLVKTIFKHEELCFKEEPALQPSTPDRGLQDTGAVLRGETLLPSPGQATYKASAEHLWCQMARSPPKTSEVPAPS